MEIGLIDADKKGKNNFPNLALMKLSAWHKKKGDNVEMVFPLKHYDRIYVSKVFDDYISPGLDYSPLVSEVIYGGTGYSMTDVLPYEVEHIRPDYSLYNIKDNAYGFLTRGCPRACSFCIVAQKEGRKSKKVSDLAEWWNGEKKITLLDPNILAAREHLDLLAQLSESKSIVDFTQGIDARLLNDKNINALNSVRMNMIHFAWDFMEQSESVLDGLRLYSALGAIQNERNRTVYVLVNFNTSMEENLYRINKLKALKYSPYVMVYDKAHASKEIKRLQRWCNNRFIFRSCDRFEDYRG